MQFTIRGQVYEIDRDQVMEAVRGVVPNRMDARNKYDVEINGQRYPIKQTIQMVTALPYLGFTAGDAYRILRKLGFDIHRLEGDVERPAGIVGNAGAGNTMKFAVTLERDEDGFVTASCPALPGCHSQGRTKEEAIANVKEAIRGYVTSMRRHGEQVPAIQEVQQVEVAV